MTHPVVVIDDVGETRDQISDALAEAGYEVEALATGGLKTATAVYARVPEPRAIVCDVYLDGSLEKGVSLITSLGESRPVTSEQVPLFAMSLLFYLITDPDAVEAIRSSGAWDYSDSELRGYAERIKKLGVFRGHPHRVLPKDYTSEPPYPHNVVEAVRGALDPRSGS